MKKLIFKDFIYESVEILGDILLVVDIQKEYQKNFGFKIYDFCKYINENIDNYRSVVFLFNGPEVGFPTQDEYIYWLIENGLNEEIVDNIEFYDKGYNFFRYPMDHGVDSDEIVKFIRYMLEKNINDSRDFTEEDLDEFYSLHEDCSEIVEYFKNYGDDNLYIPDMMDMLKELNGNIVVTGGARNECLEEVLIGLNVYDKDYTLLNKYIYF